MMKFLANVEPKGLRRKPQLTRLRIEGTSEEVRHLGEWIIAASRVGGVHAHSGMELQIVVKPERGTSSGGDE
jgi:hypothetical protein